MVPVAVVVKDPGKAADTAVTAEKVAGVAGVADAVEPGEVEVAVAVKTAVPKALPEAARVSRPRP